MTAHIKAGASLCGRNPIQVVDVSMIDKCAS